MSLPIEERKLRSRKQFLDQLAMMLGGYVAETMVFKDLTTGPSNDLQVATALARDMVTRYGMSEKIGPLALEDDGGKMLWGGRFERSEYSDKVGAEIDAEVKKIMKKAQARAKQVLTKHKTALEAIVTTLMEVETIEQNDFEKLLLAHGIKPKKEKKVKKK